jgi:SAM-dependent methyltransferase
MTWQTLQEHEARYLPYLIEDYRRKSLEQLARRYVTGRRILDMRCSTGHLAVNLAISGFEVTALDGHVKGAEMTNELARRNGVPHDIARAWDLASLADSVGQSRFDTVLCLDTLNHVLDDRAMVGQIARVLSHHGRLIISAPAFPGVHRKRDEALGHLRRYTRRGLREILEQHGLQIEMLRYWNFLALPGYVLIERLFGKQLPEPLRYLRGRFVGSLPNRILRWWYAVVENRLCFPVGLSLFVIAKRSGR